MRVMCPDNTSIPTQMMWRSFKFDYSDLKPSEAVMRDRYHDYVTSSYYRKVVRDGTIISGEAYIVYTDIRIFGLFKMLREGWSLRYNTNYRMLELYDDGD